MSGFGLQEAVEADFEVLLEIRLAAMRDSLERIGRFDPARARQRLRDGFDPAITQKIIVADQLIGFYALRAGDAMYSLDHFYILPQWQGQGFGAAVLGQIKSQCADKPLRLGALRGSDANRFYVRHGFEMVDESEWDIEYLITPR